MPNSKRAKNSKLKQLIVEQEKDKHVCRVFPETIRPRKSVFLPQLSLCQKTSLILSFFMTRSDIAAVLRRSRNSVSKYRSRALKNLTDEEIIRYRKLRKTLKQLNHFSLPVLNSPDVFDK